MNPWTVPEVSVHDASQQADDGPGLIVDVREPDEFARVRVPGSVLLPMSEFVARCHELPADRPLLMLCQSGQRSATATAYMLRQGYEQVVNVGGGIIAWYQAGLPVSTTAPTAGEGDLPRG